VKDINGGELREGGAAMLFCEVLAIDAEGIHLRVMNSEQMLLVGYKHDEVLGGLVADSELTAFEEQLPVASGKLSVKCLCVPGCSVNGECPEHGDGGHLFSRGSVKDTIKAHIERVSTLPPPESAPGRTNAIAGDPARRGLL
jgi:hypothetical protein